MANILNSLSAVKNTEVRFALRGWGQSPIVNIANINHGVNIDSRSINGIEVSPDKSVAFNGCTAIWRDVYLKLGAIRVQRPLVGSRAHQAFSSGQCRELSS